ncbi:hypothetical protein WJX81_002077 [Elliptochloris bilobata]|uniref:Uncharacterized protein n=1 Tax=Elliptochloris bilobata TaxID=381761 RepID=A0AAW1RCP0_9CHLO
MRCSCKSADHGKEPLPPFTYNSSDGRPKATIEQALSMSSAEHMQRGPARPWNLGWQMNERNLVWNDDLKLRLIKRVAAEELGCREEDMEERLQSLQALLPDMVGRLPSMKPKLIAQLASNPQRLANALVQLKRMFPGANPALLVARRPALALQGDLADVDAAGQQLRDLLPGVDVDRLVEAHPSALDVASFRAALDEARRIMPSLDLTAALNANPDVIFGFQRGASLIPYDPAGPDSDPPYEDLPTGC